MPVLQIEMPISAQEKRIADLIRQLLNEHAGTYETAVQTTVLGKLDAGWRNLLTLFSFVAEGATAPSAFEYKYENIIIARRAVAALGLRAILDKLLDQSLLETGTEPPVVEQSGSFSNPDSSRSSPREWTEWPADIFIREATDHVWAPQGPLTALEYPYYPTLEHVLRMIFGIRSMGWLDHFKGRVVFVMPDFRGRIARIVIGRDFLQADIDCILARPAELVLKVYAENSARLLAQETVPLTQPSFELRLDDKPSLASVALLFKATGELLHEKSFNEGRGWWDRDVFIAVSEQDIEQMLLTGESETIEFKEKVADSVRLAKTLVAFANTTGGTLVVGVDDNHRVVGCETKGLADRITNIIRSHCEPALSVRTEIIEYEQKSLFIIRVPKTAGQVYTVREHGPFIRANATNRTPTSGELRRLFDNSITAQLPGLG